MLDVYGDFSRDDPATALAEAARGCPYQWEPEGRALYAFRAADVRRVLTDGDFWSERAPDRRAAALPEAERERRAELRQFFARWPVFSDGAHHKRMRHAAIRLLRQVDTAALTRSCERLAAARFAEVGEDSFDWLARVARPLALEAITALTGPADAERLVGLGGVVMDELATARVEAARIGAALEAVDALREWLGAALADPPTAFVAGLAELWQDDECGPDSATALLTQIVTGAFEPTVTVLCLAAERVTGDLLTGMPPQAVREEVLRLATPFRFASRYPRRPVTVGPHRLGPGDRVVLCLGTANLDPEHFPHPLELRRRTGAPRPFSFGAGEHYCPGAPLARAVTQVLLDALRTHGVRFAVERVVREPELPMLRYRTLTGRLVPSPGDRP